MPADAPDRSNRSVPLPLFFGLTYLLSWIVWVPLVLSHFKVGPFRITEELSSIVRLLGVLMPGISAIVLTAAIEGRTSLGALLSRLWLWRVRGLWWVAAVAVYPALLVLTAGAYSWVGGTPPIERPLVTAGGLIVNIVLLAIAATGEEVGWRGLALPALQKRHSPFVASIVLGLLWATWHLPFWLLMDSFTQYGPWYLVLNYLFVVPLTLYITWLFNRTRSSLLIAVAFHLSFNILNVSLLPVTGVPLSYGFFIALQTIVAVLAFSAKAGAAARTGS